MAVTYTNRKGQTYYLHKHTTASGGVGYHFSLKPEGDLVDEIPDGYEIYESPRGQVFLRRIVPQAVTEEEVAVVRRALDRSDRLRRCRLDVKSDTITILVPESAEELSALMDLFDPGGKVTDGKREALLDRVLNYSAELRFVLLDAETRTFGAERFSYLGDIDDWIEIGDPGPLDVLVRRYVKHLGKDSFFDLM